MQKVQYGLALYRREAHAQHELIDCRYSELPMTDIDEVETKLGLPRFFKAAGERGWEFCSVVAPWAKGTELGTENGDGTRGEDEIVADRFDIQWLMFKRPAN